MDTVPLWHVGYLVRLESPYVLHRSFIVSLFEGQQFASSKNIRSSYVLSKPFAILDILFLKVALLTEGCLQMLVIAVLATPMKIPIHNDSKPSQFTSAYFSLLWGKSDLIYTSKPPLETASRIFREPVLLQPGKPRIGPLVPLPRGWDGPFIFTRDTCHWWFYLGFNHAVEIAVRHNVNK